MSSNNISKYKYKQIHNDLHYVALPDDINRDKVVPSKEEFLEEFIDMVKKGLTARKVRKLEVEIENDILDRVSRKSRYMGSI